MDSAIEEKKSGKWAMGVRRKLKMTREVFAHHLGVSKRTLDVWEVRTELLDYQANLIQRTYNELKTTK